MKAQKRAEIKLELLKIAQSTMTPGQSIEDLLSQAKLLEAWVLASSNQKSLVGCVMS